MATDLYSAVMTIPGADKALGFLQDQAAAFAYIPARLETIRRELDAVRAQAGARNDAVTLAKAVALGSGLPKLQTLYAGASGQLSGVMFALRSGVGDPLSLVPRVIGAAAQVALVFKSVDLFDNGVKALAAGTLTPDQLERLKQGGYTGVTSVPLVKVALIGGAIWLGGRLLRVW